jgi:hypothetical protein
VDVSLDAGPGVGIPDGISLDLAGHLGVSATFTLTGTDGNSRLTGSQLANGQFNISAASDVFGYLSLDIYTVDQDLWSQDFGMIEYQIF